MQISRKAGPEREQEVAAKCTVFCSREFLQVVENLISKNSSQWGKNRDESFGLLWGLYQLDYCLDILPYENCEPKANRPVTP